MNGWKKIGERVRHEREVAGMTMEALAAEIGTTRQTISRWERGDGVEITLNMLVRLCNIFNCEMGYLLCEYDCKTRAATDIQRETGLSQTALEFMQERQNTDKLRPDAPFSSPEVKVINRIVEEYATAKDPKKTALFSMMRLFDIPRQWLGNATTYITVETLLENGSKHKNGSFAEKTDAIEYLETILAHQIAERMIKLSKGDGEHG